MPWKVETDTQSGVINVVYTGLVTGQDVASATEKALSVAIGDGPNYFFADLFDAELSMSVAEIFEVPDLWDTLNSSRLDRVAVIFKDDLAWEKDFEFFEDVCINRGWKVRVFSSRESGMEWLISI